MTNNTLFDYIIVGNGLAGLQLALKMSSNDFFNDKKIALIDYSSKNINDKTWSFWEKEPSQWNNMVYKSWNKTAIISLKKTIHLNLTPYSYKSIRSIDFYKTSLKLLKQKTNLYFIIDTVKSIQETSKNITVTTKTKKYTASHVFDSRIPETYTKKNHVSITQHFKGWIIKTEKEVFDDTKVIMMDYRLKDGNQTSFTYVLPFSKTEALIEFTYFTKTLVNEATYDNYIKTYINKYLNLEAYTIIETEKGKIPMSNYPFYKHNTKKITKIGTGGGWVKASTGYSFKHTEKKISKIVENIKSNKKPSNKLFKTKYKFYDKIFLKVLKDDNHKGEWIFNRFYSKNTTKTIFKFLDEESSFFEDFKIMASLFSWTFIKAFFKTL